LKTSILDFFNRIHGPTSAGLLKEFFNRLLAQTRPPHNWTRFARLQRRAGIVAQAGRCNREESHASKPRLIGIDNAENLADRRHRLDMAFSTGDLGRPRAA
jgi:hypothetical protein